jgi:hypothetical protein
MPEIVTDPQTPMEVVPPPLPRPVRVDLAEVTPMVLLGRRVVQIWKPWNIHRQGGYA